MNYEIYKKKDKFFATLKERKIQELKKVKEENRKLLEKIDILMLEILKYKSLGIDKMDESSSNHKILTHKRIINCPPPISPTGVHFPVVLPKDAKVISRILYPTKKLAYYYAVLGVKHTFKNVLKYIKRKIKNTQTK